MDATYAKLMAKFGYGRCLYRPPSTTEMRPGSVGYWDSNAKWQPIAQLDDSEDLKAKGFRPPQEELLANDSTLDEGWSPLYSSSVTESDITAEVMARLPEGAATGKAFYKYQGSENAGAVLITVKPISARSFLHESPFSRWTYDNIDALMASPRGEDIKTHGLAIIRDTYSTKKCLLNVWESGSRAFSVGLTVDAHGVLNLGVGGGWSDATDAGGCREFSPKNPEDEVVVCASGLVFKIRRLFGITMLSHPAPLRSANTEGSLVETRQIKSKEREDLVFELEREVFGNPLLAPVEEACASSDWEDDEDSMAT
ncbi:hypothetical protein B0T26DRAFT_732278 [Lasiosphaeria miniovina]|uniref:Uncharacterized protein n=1 Tax=Lasiosphaeria miniovina TaxID=1954250 RepID=A0AA39ZU43_9PEZI|nr:uncharacterized protein B0T26DRAFT_732278 [Lasiosphaeria miniovina]KAK0703693.1 hypothetical protein B0T26DRAFT_732278 [Lasiosphaeria miniovina]